MALTTWTHDIPVQIDALLVRLRACDGKASDAAVLTWEQCQLLLAEIDRLRAELAKKATQPSFDALIDEIKMLKVEYEKVRKERDDLDEETEYLRCGC